ncbi:hypothetical protein WOLCODRAFT_158758 [Wolfiporia cocos MD-104 SS10]|uniref:Uncharacterized protein n=1 Tax=Wolfiporia cocos (strain MD-104) TaxID=742152 RepID=A0A2H3JH92_WOLCO|nr:hypothetical protein WOLCODRAFT_158758 [Wolfiporia cocos MD-104 SS10]
MSDDEDHDIYSQRDAEDEVKEYDDKSAGEHSVEDNEIYDNMQSVCDRPEFAHIVALAHMIVAQWPPDNDAHLPPAAIPLPPLVATALQPPLPQPLGPVDETQFFDHVKRALDNTETSNEFLKLVICFMQDITDTAWLVRESRSFLGDGELIAQSREILGWYEWQDRIAVADDVGNFLHSLEKKATIEGKNGPVWTVWASEIYGLLPQEELTAIKEEVGQHKKEGAKEQGSDIDFEISPEEFIRARKAMALANGVRAVTELWMRETGWVGMVMLTGLDASGVLQTFVHNFGCDSNDQTFEDILVKEAQISSRHLHYTLFGFGQDIFDRQPDER